jgi:hypothetical protein
MVKKLIWTAVILYCVLAAAAVGGLAWFVSSHRATGPIVTQERSVAGFDRVRLNGFGDLRITQGDRESLIIQGQSDVLDQLESRVEGTTLVIEQRTHWRNRRMPTKPVTYTLTLIELREIEVNGSGEVTCADLKTDDLELAVSGSGGVDLNVAADEITCRISGSGAVELAGAADSQAASISGSGSYQARDLRTEAATVAISGSGSAEVNARDRLEVTISGSGELTYHGDPAVEQHISGSGEVSRVGS